MSVHRDVVRKGLAQIPKRDLRRLLRYIDAGKPLVLNGDVVRGKYG